jgi:hypothetical protein
MFRFRKSKGKAYFDDGVTLVRLYKLFLTERKLARICANGVTIKSSTWARSPLPPPPPPLTLTAVVVCADSVSLILRKRKPMKLARTQRIAHSPLAGDARVPRHRLGRHFKVRVGAVEEGLSPLRHVLKYETGCCWAAAFEWRPLSIFDIKAELKRMRKRGEQIRFTKAVKELSSSLE